MADEYEAAKLRWAGGRAAPRLAWQYAQKDGCAQRTGANARPKPTSSHITHNWIDAVATETPLKNCRKIQKGSGAKAYMRKSFLIYEEMCEYCQ